MTYKTWLWENYKLDGYRIILYDQDGNELGFVSGDDYTAAQTLFHVSDVAGKRQRKAYWAISVDINPVAVVKLVKQTAIMAASPTQLVG